MFSKKDIVVRYKDNPILTPGDMPAACCAVYNSGCVKTEGGTYIMASRYESPEKKQYTWVSRSDDGYTFTPDPEPVQFLCNPEDQEEFDRTIKMKGPGIGAWWDPRINPLNGKYYITYAAVSGHGCRIGIGETKDFKTVHHVSFPLHIQNRNAVLFPEKINGEYWMLHRPQQINKTGSMWIASSPDLFYWGNCKVIADPQHYLESVKIGPAAPPIKTGKGWLEIYHGVFGNCNGLNYAMGAMLLDLEEPWKIVARAQQPILFVEESYEMMGQVPNVIFPGSVIPEEDGSVKIYYGAADYVQCLATAKLDDLIDACLYR